MALVNNVHKQAVKASVARMVVKGHSPRYIALAVNDVVRQMALEVGDLQDVRSLQQYAEGVERNGERVSNRKWEHYPQNVQFLRSSIVCRAEAMVEEAFAF